MNLLIKALLIAGIFTFGSYGTYRTIDMHGIHGESATVQENPSSDEKEKLNQTEEDGSNQSKQSDSPTSPSIKVPEETKSAEEQVSPPDPGGDTV